MPVKLIVAIIFAILVAVFTGFNLDNKTNFWFFHNFENVSVLLLVLISFLAGVIVTLPFTFGKKKKSSEKKDSDVKAVTQRKKGVFKSKGSEKKAEVVEAEEEKSGTPTSTDEDYTE